MWGRQFDIVRGKMATKGFIQAQLKKLESNYGKERFKVTQPMFDLWVDMFKEYKEEGLKVSVDEYIRTNEYPPTVASIVKIYKEKENYRREIWSYIKHKYVWVCRWIEEEPTKETLLLFCEYAFKFSKDERRARIDDVAQQAIAYYNDTQEKKPFKDWLKV